MSRTSLAGTVLPCLLVLIGGAMLIGGGSDYKDGAPAPATEKPPAPPIRQPPDTATVNAHVDESLYVDLLERDETPAKLPWKKIRLAMNKRIAVEFTKEPLDKAVAAIGKLAGFSAKLDEESLLVEGIYPEEPVTLQNTKLRARHVFNLILEPIGLTWTVQGDEVIITTEIVAEDRMVTANYDLRPLVELGFTQRAIERAIKANTSGPWVNEDGIGGSFWKFDYVMVVRQTFKVHREIASVLSVLKVAAASSKNTGILPLDARFEAVDFAATNGGLNRKITIDYQDKPLNEAIADLAKRTGLQILFNEIAMGEEGITLDEPITFRLKNVTARTALKRMLETLHLTYVYEDGLLKVTTEIDAEERTATLVYIVRDLYEEGYSGRNLIDILHNITNGPWAEDEGYGGTVTEAAWGILLVRQTNDVHDDVTELLAELREMLANSKRPLIVPIASSKPRLVTRIYQTAPRPPSPPKKTENKAEKQKTKEKKEEKEKPAKQPRRQKPPVIDDLLKAIPTFIAPKSWEQNGGNGKIGKVGSLLVVHQTKPLQAIILACVWGLDSMVLGRGGVGFFSVSENSLWPMAFAQVEEGGVFYSHPPFYGNRVYAGYNYFGGPFMGWDYVEDVPPVKPKRPANVKLTADEESWILDHPNFVQSRRVDEKELLEALEKKGTVEFNKTPLKKALKSLAEQGGINVLIDLESLTNAGIANNEPISTKYENVTLRRVFDQILTPLELGWFTSGDILLVKTRIEFSEQMGRYRYNVRPLLQAGYDAADLTNIVAAITPMVDRSRWWTIEKLIAASDAPLDFAVPHTVCGDYLFAVHSQGSHEFVKVMFAALETVAYGSRKHGTISVRNPENRLARKALRSKLNVGYENIRLEEVVADLSKRARVTIVIEECPKEAAPKAADRKVSLPKADRRLSEILDIIKCPSCNWYVEHGKIVISKRSQKIQSMAEIVVYNVQELAAVGFNGERLTKLAELNSYSHLTSVEPIPGTLLVSAHHYEHQYLLQDLQMIREIVANQKEKGTDLSALAADARPRTRTYHLIEQLPAADLENVIPRFVEPVSWKADSPAKIHQVGDVLIIRQSETVQRRIEAFLKILHKEYDYDYIDGQPSKNRRRIRS